MAPARKAPHPVMIVEDDWIVANGLRAMLRTDSDLEVVGIATSPAEVTGILERSPVEFALVDIDLGGGACGIDLTKRVLAPRGIRVIFTSAHADPVTLGRASGVGATSFVVKPFTQKQLFAALKLALAGPSPSAAASASALDVQLDAARRALAQLAAALGAPVPEDASVTVRLRADPRLEALTERERQVLHGLLQHRRIPAIAEHLGISQHTARNHLKSTFAKLRVSSQQELLDAIIERAPDAETDPPSAPRPRARPGNE
jgi:DNA-binding NarL/FixJ family response regulator